MVTNLESRRMKVRGKIAAVTDIQLYYQPPESIKLVYPCVIYSLDGANSIHADNLPYSVSFRFSLMLIDKDPDSIHVGELLGIQGCRLSTTYKADNLNHWTFTVYE